MSRLYSNLTKEILNIVSKSESVLQNKLFSLLEISNDRKAIYDSLFRLEQQGMIEKKGRRPEVSLVLTEEGKNFLLRSNPVRDEVWKLVIFDIPEKQKKVRNHLRNKLKTLGFKKWQDSIWASPFVLDPLVETELKQLAGIYFVRLIKTTDINYTKDLEELFK